MTAKKTTKPDAAVMTNQFITDGVLGSFLGYMPNPDDVASGTAESYETYRQMRADPRIKSLLNKIKTLSLNFPAHFKQGAGCSDAVFDFVKGLPFFENLYKKEKRMLAALDYGFSVSEVVWQNPAHNNGKWIPETVITRKPERFFFNKNWELFCVQMGLLHELNQPYKWLVYQHDPDDENPYGTSVLRCVYWAWMFKRAGYEFWLQATEKFSVKSIIALFKAEGDEATIQTRAAGIASMLRGIESGSSAAVANVENFHELSMAGNLKDFASLVDACDLQISYGLTGQAIATSKTDGGSLALGEVQAEMLYEDCKGIALELQSVLQKLVDWIVLLNFGEAAVSPQLVFDVEKKASFDQLMAAVDRGIPVSLSALYEEYHLPKPANDEDAFVREGTAAGGELELSDPFGKKKACTKKRQAVSFVS